MKTTIYITALLLPAMFLFGCDSNDLMNYSGGANIYFASGTENIHLPSAQFKAKALADTSRFHTFYYEDESVTRAEIKYHLYVTGGPKEFDRPFRLEQIIEPGAVNAVPGTDFLAFDSEEMKRLLVLKAGEVHMEMPVVVFRTDGKDQYVLRFRLVENENFIPAFPELGWRKAIFTSKLQRPNAWNADQERDWFGKYSLVKHEWFIEQTKYNWDDEFINMLKSGSDLRNYLIYNLKTQLAEINKERAANNLGPWTDEDGVEIQLGQYAYK